MYFTRKCVNCDALQLEATHTATVILCFNRDAHAKYEVAQAAL